jgi:hypothetical protein
MRLEVALGLGKAFRNLQDPEQRADFRSCVPAGRKTIGYDPDVP